MLSSLKKAITCKLFGITDEDLEWSTKNSKYVGIRHNDGTEEIITREEFQKRVQAREANTPTTQ